MVTYGPHAGHVEGGDDDGLPAQPVGQDGQQDEPRHAAHELGRQDGIPDVLVVAVQAHMGSDGVGEVDLALNDAATGLFLQHLQVIPTGECGSDEQVARQEDSEGHHQPFQAHEDYGVYLELAAIAHAL